MQFIYWLIFSLLHSYLSNLTLLITLPFMNHSTLVVHLQLNLLFPFYLRYSIKIFKVLHFFMLIYLFLILITFSPSLHENTFNSKFHNFLHILHAKLSIFLYHDFIFSFLIKPYDDASYGNLFPFLIYHK